MLLKDIYIVSKRIFKDCIKDCKKKGSKALGFLDRLLNQHNYFPLVVGEALIVGMYCSIPFLNAFVDDLNKSVSASTAASFRFYFRATFYLTALSKISKSLDRYFAKAYFPNVRELDTSKRQDMSTELWLQQVVRDQKRREQVTNFGRKSCKCICDLVNLAVNAITWSSAALENEQIRRVVTVESDDFEKILRNNVIPVMVAATVAGYVGCYAWEIRQKRINNEIRRGR